ncbi:hypothetical protein ASF61_12105 [Duganella sp. Leaf126]|uniref:hypothetical protein n=1 Tax=Duganella sp. Leaf126 TaxID=1736266 RepID=UPI0006F75F3D|nr:hypothetical protein [Duganella sp. Leaf126]KQQ33780.1 hypothetical protein ASF61_12105 [Duganella sp. Leaf126]
MNVSFNSAAPAYSTTFAPSAPVAVQPEGAALSSEAVDLSEQSAVVATLGGSTGGPAVYSATGLLGTLEQAGVSEEPLPIPADGSNIDTSETAQQALDQGILSGLTAPGSASGIYTPGGSNNLSAQASSNWADILKSDPTYASTVIGSSINTGILNTINVTA